MKNRIKEYIKQYGLKHFSRKIKKDQELWSEILQKTSNIPNIKSDSERIYVALYDVNSICEKGNKKNFGTFSTGYGFCGRPNSCICAKNSISKNVSETKKLETKEKKKEVNEKRKQTNFTRYGVTNSGQSKKAKDAHKKFYANLNNVQAQLKNYQQTMLEKYGVINPRHLEEINDKIKSTLMERYGVDNPLKNPNIKSKVQKTKRDNRLVQQNLITEHFSKLILNQELLNYIESISSNIMLNDTTTISPYNLDIYLPNNKIAIIYSELKKQDDIIENYKNYHLTKYQKCLDKGIRLVTIFEDEWVNKKEICKNRLNHILNNNKGIGARKLRIKEISNKEAIRFFNNHHIQGGVSGHWSFGAFLGEELVAAMSFSKPRPALGRKEGAIELLRFCTDGKSYPGVANRLFKAFTNMNITNEIISYCDLRWGTGELYIQLGFNESIQNLKPNYWYYTCKDKIPKRYHRFNFTKGKLVKLGNDINKSESQIMKELKYDRIYDCGNKKFIWKRT